MDEKFEKLLRGVLGNKRFELFLFLCQNADSNGFIAVRIKDLQDQLGQSKPTVIASLKFLEEKRLFKRLKNGFCRLYLPEGQR